MDQTLDAGQRRTAGEPFGVKQAQGVGFWGVAPIGIGSDVVRSAAGPDGLHLPALAGEDLVGAPSLELLAVARVQDCDGDTARAYQ